MSIHYLLDGYNIIHKMPPALNLPKLEDQRRYLIRFIEQCRPQGSLNNRVTVVFDGNLEVFGGMTSSVVKIIFSQGESADDTIKKIVKKAHNAKNIIVVSDDRDIQYAVRALGAKISSVQAFLNKAGVSNGEGRKGLGQAKRGFVKGHSAETEKYIPKSDEYEITSEFGKIWLKSNQKRKE